MKHLFIVNPAAGKCDRSVQLKNAVGEVFRGLDYAVQVSKGPGDCTRLAREAAEQGEELRIYACGGDGTLNEVVNGVVGFDHVAVTHVPSGSGNDFIKLFSEPDRFRELEQFLNSEETAMDLIQCRSGEHVYYSNNICSMGLDARIAAEMGRFRRMPMVSGNGAYFLSIGVNLLKGIHKPYIIDVNGETISGDQTMICVCSGQYYGGSFHPVPDALPDDGLLDVLIVKPVTLLQVPGVIGKYQSGQYAQLPDLIRHFRTDTIRVQCTEESVVNIDGESLSSMDVTFTVLPGALRFFYPRGLTYPTAKRAAALHK